jgi:Polysaccharide lyase family 4, domain II
MSSRSNSWWIRASALGWISWLLAALILGCDATPMIEAEDVVSSPAHHGLEGAIMGRAIDGMGQPHASRVRAFRLSVSEGHLSFLPVCSSSTDPEGNYSCPGLSPGKYILSAQPLATGRTAVDVPRQAAALAFTLYPDTSDPDSSVAIRLQPGVTQIVDLTLRSVPTYSVSGSLPDQDHRAAVSLFAIGNAGHQIDTGMYLEGKAAFRIQGVPSGTYLLRATWPGDRAYPFTSGEHQGSALITVDGSDVSGVQVRETPFAVVEGTVRNTELEQGTLGSITLLSMNEPDRQFTAKLSREGNFSIRNVPAGAYQIRAGEPTQAFIRMLQVDGTEQTNEIVTIVPGRPRIILDVAVSSRVATIRGSTVLHSETGAVLAQSETSGQFYSATIDHDGKFSVTGLGPGNYYLYAWGSLEEVEYAEPHFLARHIADRKEVSVTEGATITGVELELSAPGP